MAHLSVCDAVPSTSSVVLLTWAMGFSVGEAAGPSHDLAFVEKPLDCMLPVSRPWLVCSVVS